MFILSLIVLVTAMNQSFMNRVKQDRYFDHLTPNSPGRNSLYHRLFIRSDRWRYGDLYGLSYLPAYKFPLEPFKLYDRSAGKPVNNRILYIIGDSFLADKTLSGAFDGFDNVIFLDRRFPFGPIKLDSTKQNFLVMEFAERNLNDYSFFRTDEVKWSQAAIRSRLFNASTVPPEAASNVSTSIFARLNKLLFNKDLSRNLELLLFDDKSFSGIKEAKAALNYSLFARVAKETAVSTDKKRLFLNVTVDTSSIQSTFRPKSPKEMEGINSNLQDAGCYYTAIGFRKIFLSVIPNPVSIYDEKRALYNHLLERIERSSGLYPISLFDRFKREKQNLYYRSDAHWNPVGMDAWVTETNKVLQNNLH